MNISKLIKNEMKLSLHHGGKHQLRRHPINNHTVWQCYYQNKNLSNSQFITAQDDVCQCESSLNSKVGLEDQESYQGYECTHQDCFWNICIGCLIYQSLQNYQSLKNQNSNDFLKIGLNNDVSSKYPYEKKKLSTRYIFTEDYTQLCKYDQILKDCQQKIDELMDFDDYKRFVTNQKPLSVFNDMMKHFVEKCLCREDEEKLFRISLPLRSYFPSNDDEDLIDSEKIQNPINKGNLFVTLKKEIQIVQNQQNEQFFIVVKLIEQLANPPEESEANVIKTLRIFKFNPQNKEKFTQVKTILLEHIQVKNYSESQIEFNQITVLDHNYIIYFWRRCKNRYGSWEMQLWKYDINAEIGDEDLEIVSEIESSKITKSKFSLPITSKQPFHVMFAYRIDKKPMKYKDEIDFLENQYILCQPYFIKHKDETEGEKRNERISFFETPNCKVKGHQTERKHEYQPNQDRKFEIYHLKNLQEPISEQCNQQSCIPICQIFAIETKSQVQSDKIEKLSFTIFDSKIYNLSINFKEFKNKDLNESITFNLQSDSNKKIPEGSRNESFIDQNQGHKKEPQIIKNLPRYLGWMQGGHEVQWIDINLPIFDQGKETVYYTIQGDKNGWEIVLIYPLKNKSINDAIIDKIKMYQIENLFCHNTGQRLLHLSNRKQYYNQNQNRVYFKNLNQQFIESINQVYHNQNTIDLNSYVSSNRDRLIDTVIVQHRSFTFLAINPISDPINIECLMYFNRSNSAIKIDTKPNGKQSKDKFSYDKCQQDKLMAFFYNQQQREIKELVLNNNQNFVVINENFNGVLYTTEMVSFQMNPEIKRSVKKKFGNENQLLKKISDNNNLFKIDCQSNNNEQIIISHPNHTKNLIKVKILKEPLIDRTIDCIIYQRNKNKDYMMLFELQKPGQQYMHYFFVKFTYQELLKNIQEDFLIDAERTPIYWLQGYDSIEKMKNLNQILQETWFEDITENNDEVNEENLYTIQCVCEKVIDMAYDQDFISFLILVVNKFDFDSPRQTDDHEFITNPQKLFFKVITINDCKILDGGTIDLNLNPKYEQDLSYKNIRLTKSSNFQEKSETDFFDNETRKQKCRYLVGMLQNQKAQIISFLEIEVKVNTYKDFTQNDNSEVQSNIIGKRILISSTQILKEFKIYDKFELFPLRYDSKSLNELKIPDDKKEELKQQGIIGTQLVMIGGRKSQQCFIVPMIWSIPFNNIFKYQSDIAFLGHQTFIDDTNQNLAFFQLVSVQLKKLAIDKCQLDQNEINLILNEFQDNILHMREFRIEKTIMSSYLNVVSENFFNIRENFHGSSMLDVYFNENQVIEQAYKNQKNFKIYNSIIERTIRNDAIRIRKLREQGLVRDILIIFNDFNFNNQISKAINMNESQVVKFLLDFIMRINSRKYSKFIVQVLSEILDKGTEEIKQQIKCILGFFSHGSCKFNCNLECNMEEFVFEKKLPMKSNKMIEFIPIQRSISEMDLQKEVVEEIFGQISSGQTFKNFYTVEHSFINFGRIILSEKLRCIQNNDDIETQFGEVFFANLMVQDEIEFYSQSIIQKIIDYQFKETYIFNFINLMIYVIFFFVPFLIVIFLHKYDSLKEKDLIKEICLYVMMVVQIYFFLWEICQAWQMQWEYLLDFQNISEILQFPVFIVTFVQYQSHIGSDESDIDLETRLTFKDRLVSLILVVQMFIKLMFHLKIFPEYGFMVSMIVHSIFSAKHFFGFFLMWLLFFTIQYRVLNIQFDGAQYGLGPFVDNLINTLRISLGDIQTPVQQKDDFLMSLFWIIWLSHLIFMLIIMMNFIIAVISDSYTDVEERKIQFIYKEKAQLNLDCQQLLAIFKQQKDLRCLCITCDKAFWDDSKSQEKDLALIVKESISQIEKFQTYGGDGDYNNIILSVNHLQNNMKENQNHIENNLNEMNDRNIDFNRDISGEVKDVKTELSQMKESQDHQEETITTIRDNQQRILDRQDELMKKMDILLKRNDKKCLYCNLEK